MVYVMKYSFPIGEGVYSAKSLVVAYVEDLGWVSFIKTGKYHYDTGMSSDEVVEEREFRPQDIYYRSEQATVVFSCGWMEDPQSSVLHEMDYHEWREEVLKATRYVRISNEIVDPDYGQESTQPQAQSAQIPVVEDTQLEAPVLNWE